MASSNGNQMAWNDETARKRIRKLLREAPAVRVERFETDYLKGYRDRGAILARQGRRQAPPLFELGRGRAVLAHTVQIYVRIVNFDQFRMAREGETEQAHERMLRFTHLLYSACDRVADQCDVQRVDYHGARMHAVVLGRDARGVTIEDVGKALRFITVFQEVASRAVNEFSDLGIPIQFRFGIDAGSCVAIDNGTAIEPEPMFLGSPANHAAKLADGEQPGIFASDKVRGPIGSPSVGLYLEQALQLDEASIGRAITARSRADSLSPAFGIESRRDEVASLIETWRSEIDRGKALDTVVPQFSFRHQPPPLSDIRFADLSPSKSLRLPLASLFADLSGFTAYVDAAINGGTVAEAVQALYVLRAEFQNVVEEDFGGRKVRFIGDCIHAVMAEGSPTESDPKRSVVSAFETAAALQASFQVVQQELPDTRRLGLAIGIEHGTTPITRLGIRGRRSVRVASSVACCRSEREQRAIPDSGVRVGPRAMELLPASAKLLLDRNGATVSLDYDDVRTSLRRVAAASFASPVVMRSPPVSASRPGRAHFLG